jgi:hypothetical protein
MWVMIFNFSRIRKSIVYHCIKKKEVFSYYTKGLRVLLGRTFRFSWATKAKSTQPYLSNVSCTISNTCSSSYSTPTEIDATTEFNEATQGKRGQKPNFASTRLYPRCPHLIIYWLYRSNPQERVPSAPIVSAIYPLLSLDKFRVLIWKSKILWIWIIWPERTTWMATPSNRYISVYLHNTYGFLGVSVYMEICINLPL